MFGNSVQLTPRRACVGSPSNGRLETVGQAPPTLNKFGCVAFLPAASCVKKSNWSSGAKQGQALATGQRAFFQSDLHRPRSLNRGTVQGHSGGLRLPVSQVQNAWRKRLCQCFGQCLGMSAGLQADSSTSNQLSRPASLCRR